MVKVELDILANFVYIFVVSIIDELTDSKQSNHNFYEFNFKFILDYLTILNLWQICF